jgi:hypothetical protein
MAVGLESITNVVVVVSKLTIPVFVVEVTDDEDTDEY